MEKIEELKECVSALEEAYNARTLINSNSFDKEFCENFPSLAEKFKDKDNKTMKACDRLERIAIGKMRRLLEGFSSTTTPDVV
jgi:hypothetical protein